MSWIVKKNSDNKKQVYMKSSASRRNAIRKETDGVDINDLTSMTNYSVIARYGKIVNASKTGFLLEIDRHALEPEELRDNLTLESTMGQNVVLYLPQMNLDLDGTITRANHIGKGKFVIAIQFSPEVPDYWRECLVELLPEPGEFEEALPTE